jgi:hypothetical protein
MNHYPVVHDANNLKPPFYFMGRNKREGRDIENEGGKGKNGKKAEITPFFLSEVIFLKRRFLGGEKRIEWTRRK